MCVAATLGLGIPMEVSGCVVQVSAAGTPVLHAVHITSTTFKDCKNSGVTCVIVVLPRKLSETQHGHRSPSQVMRHFWQTNVSHGTSSTNMSMHITHPK